MMVQELPRSASNKQQQQQQQQGDDRGDMPMEVIMDLANALGNMDETGMNGARSLAPWRHSVVQPEVVRDCALELGSHRCCQAWDPSCMAECFLHAFLLACLASAPACCVTSLMTLELFDVASQTFSR